MNIVASHSEGLNFEKLRKGIAQSQEAYSLACEELGERPTDGLSSSDFYRQLKRTSRNVVVRDVFTLSDDISELSNSEGFDEVLRNSVSLASESEGVAKAIGIAVNSQFSAFINSDSTSRSVAVDTATIIEINCTRSRGHEVFDKGSSFFEPDTFGYVYVDTRLQGLNHDLDEIHRFMNMSVQLRRENPDSLPRNGAQVTTVPVYRMPESLIDQTSAAPRNRLLARQAIQTGTAVDSTVARNTETLAPASRIVIGEYNMVRCFGVVVNSLDCNPDDYMDENAVARIMVERFIAKGEELKPFKLSYNENLL